MNSKDATSALSTFADRTIPAVQRTFSIIPVQPRGKAPLRGAKSRVNTEEGVQAFAAQVPSDANYGICSDDRYTILETDDRARFTALLGQPLPATFCVSARPNRGYWIFEQTPKTLAITGCPTQPGLFEWRHTNQYCVGFGSIHPDTGKEYRIVADVAPAPFPDWLVEKLLALAKETSPSSKPGTTGIPDANAIETLKSRFFQNLDPQDLFGLENFEIGSLHPTLMEFAGFLHDGKRTEDEIADILEKLAAEYGHREARGRRELDDIAEWVVKKEPCELCLPDNHPRIVENAQLSIGMTAFRNAEARAKWVAENIDVLDIKQKPPEEASGKGEFKFPEVPRCIADYALLPLRAKFDGWFGRGRVSIVGGSSGAGKTSLVCDLLHKQWRKSCVLGHVGAGLRPLIIFADRGELSNAETFDRLGLANANLPIAHLSVCWDAAAGQRILELIEEQSPLPQIVFVEGADTLVSDAAKTQVVAPFLSALQKIAAHYHIAIVLSVGAPKSKPREQHTLKRDRIFGSQIWPRMADTIVTLEAVGDGTSGHRDLTVQHRNATPESFELEFQNGLLVERHSAADIDALDIWISERDPESWFTRGEAIKAMNDGQTGMKKTKVCDRIKDMLLRGVLQKQWNKDRKIEELQLKPGPVLNTSEAERMRSDMKAFDGKAPVVALDQAATERELREIFKDREPEKVERMIQDTFDTETRA